jgi:hypothetical protein
MRYILAFCAAHILMVVVVLTLLGCGNGTGIPAVDSVLVPRKDCALDVALENQGTQPLTMTALLHQASASSDCEGSGYASQEKVVAASSSDRIHLDLQCRHCDMETQYGVSRMDKSVLYTERDGAPNIFCSDHNCLQR